MNECQWGKRGCLPVRRRFCCCTRRLTCHRKVRLCRRIHHYYDVPCDTHTHTHSRTPSILPWYECDAIWSFIIISRPGGSLTLTVEISASDRARHTSWLKLRGISLTDRCLLYMTIYSVLWGWGSQMLATYPEIHSHVYGAFCHYCYNKWTDLSDNKIMLKEHGVCSMLTLTLVKIFPS